MAKLALFVIAALVAISSSQALKCYQCDDCKDYKDSKACGAKDKGCYIRGDPDTEKWKRGCDVDEATACANLPDKHKCSFCTDEECNSGAFVTGSIVLSVGVAAVVGMLR